MLPERHLCFYPTEDAFDSISDSSSDMDDQSIIDTPEFSPISGVSDSEILNMESSVTETEVSEDSTGEIDCEVHADPICTSGNLMYKQFVRGL